MEYLDFFPTDEVDRNNLQKCLIKFHALVGHIDFTHFDENDDEMCIFMARRVILAIIGAKIFLDPNTYDVSLNLVKNLGDLSKEGRKSWGLEALACLYRNLSKGSMPSKKGIDGPLLLLQYCAWERMPRITPRVTTRKEDRPYAYRSFLANRWNGDHSNIETPGHVLTVYLSFFHALTNE
uniref:serine/threonine-protein phosphatase 7 long form homolog n=1 Tax=Erigeron canadensis TaxID=72917 RepID=UPI001CB93DA1|nr:serine/threonine-protein phosphatase 7 long form homolog [Erigeron canadensis]